MTTDVEYADAVIDLLVAQGVALTSTAAAKAALEAIQTAYRGGFLSNAELAAKMTAFIDAQTAANALTAGRNRLLNAAFMVNQFNPGPIAAAAGTVTNIADGWRVNNLGTAAGVTIAIETVNDAEGQTRAFQWTNGAAYAPAASDAIDIHTVVIAIDALDLGWGTPDAKPITLSFDPNIMAAGTYSVAVFGEAIAGRRSYVTTFTVGASAWTPIKITVPGDTTIGAYELYENRYLVVTWDLGCGSDFETATPNTWLAGDYRRVAGSARLNATAAATYAIRQPQLERGETATDFEFEPYYTTLDKCQRRYHEYGNHLTNASGVIGQAIGTSLLVVNKAFAPPMRQPATLSIYSNLTLNTVRRVSTNAYIALAGVAFNTYDEGLLYLSTSGAPFVVGEFYDFALIADCIA